MATNAQTVLAAKGLDAVIDAMRDIQTEGDMWTLAERLVALVPTGTAGFGDVIDRATKAGVAGKLSANTLRLYRDTANRWPADKRVRNVSFSAHREAMVLPNISEAARMLNDLAKNGGPGKVTVGAVRKAVAVKQGRKPTGRAAQSGASGSTASVKYADILRDLQDNGGAAFIAAIPSSHTGNDLDKLHAGLNKVIAHVERQRAKIARASAAATAKRAANKQPAEATAKATPKPKNGNGKAPVTSKSAPRSKKQGDLRGL
jgi:hypothetical protein